MTLKEKFLEILYKQSHDDSECLRIKFENIDKLIESQEKISDDFAIEFANWYRIEDVQENADKYFGYSDKDMLNEFKKLNNNGKSN